MSGHPRNTIQDIRGAARLAVVGTAAATEVVESVHASIAGRWAGPPGAGAMSGRVYRRIREITRIAGEGVDRVLAPLEVLLAETTPGVRRAAVLAALNGVVGDHLAETGNPLATPMRLCRGGVPLTLDPASLRSAIPDLNGRIVVLLHGLCGNDRDWQRSGHDHGEDHSHDHIHDHGEALARDLGFTPVYLHYNSGRHISENGRDFADLMDRLVEAWPVPIDDLVMIGHSMGGLVARSACHYGESAAWRSSLTRLVCLGTPHHGAPLERGGNGLQTLVGVSRYLAPLGRLGKLRSAGITDLRYGAFLDSHWAGRDRFEPTGDTREAVDLPAGVACYAVAATMSIRGRRHPLGDGLVPVPSALGQHRDPRLDLGFPPEHTRVVTETGHIDLLGSAEVYTILRDWLAVPPDQRIVALPNTSSPSGSGR